MPSEIPKSMQAELGRWNNGSGIDLMGWVSCLGNIDLAVGYTTIFWPTFEVVGDYLLVEGSSKETIEAFENQENSTPMGVEWVLNHLHMIDIHCDNEVEATVDHCLKLGKTLQEIYSAKLAWQFPDRPCEVEFYIPDDQDDLVQYQISFWQKKWDRRYQD
ncbi:hypothetical protein [Roseovarius phycicola]